MEQNAIVRALDAPDTKRKNAVVVEPLSSMDCAGCSQACAKRHSYLTVLNLKNFQLKINSLVKISISKKQEKTDALISIFFPIIMAIAGYLLSNPIFTWIMKLIKKDSAFDAVCPEGTKALITVIFAAIAVFAVLTMAKHRLTVSYPEITDVIEPSN